MPQTLTATMADQELSTQCVRKAPTAWIAALEPSTQMALKQCRPRASVPPALMLTAITLTLTPMTKSRMLHYSHPPLKHPVIGTGHRKLKMWGGQATSQRWDQRLTAFHGAQRGNMVLPFENTPDIATLPRWISQASILQSCVALTG
jgi:hypothetical protein